MKHILALSFLSLLLVAPHVAHAQDDDEPWSDGVSQENKDLANAAFRDANSLLKDNLFSDAVVQYRAALEHWDHPAIHYNMALALMNLEKPIEVYTELEEAMRYEGRALGPDKLEAAQRYLKLVSQQIAEVEITADQPGVEIVLDGAKVLTGPGTYKTLVRIGEHSVIARKAGYVTQNETKVLAPGDKLNLSVKMYTVDEVTRYRRKWAVWQPWAVVGGGAAFVIVGGTLHALARSGFTAYDDGIRACGGCVPDDSLRDEKDGAQTKQTLAFVSYGLGAVALAAGAAFAYMNRAQPYRIDQEDRPAPRLTVTPNLLPGGGGVSAMLRF
ncbi:MAG TPA: hypothetical protein VML75_24110 [Kofleriaceae bacterium]|nr:hypothetical protein [Kofleriaceae bacterium]